MKGGWRKRLHIYTTNWLNKCMHDSSITSWTHFSWCQVHSWSESPLLWLLHITLVLQHPPKPALWIPSGTLKTHYNSCMPGKNGVTIFLSSLAWYWDYGNVIKGWSRIDSKQPWIVPKGTKCHSHMWQCQCYLFNPKRIYTKLKIASTDILHTPFLTTTMHTSWKERTRDLIQQHWCFTCENYSRTSRAS